MAAIDRRKFQAQPAGLEKRDTLPHMSRFQLCNVPTAALIWELHDRGIAVESPAAPVETRMSEPAVASGEGKVIQLPVGPKR